MLRTRFGPRPPFPCRCARFSIARDLAAGRLGVDAIALLAMSAALALGQPLAGIVVAIMYTGGTVLEDYAVARAERSLKVPRRSGT